MHPQDKILLPVVILVSSQERARLEDEIECSQKVNTCSDFYEHLNTTYVGGNRLLYGLSPLYPNLRSHKCGFVGLFSSYS